MLVILYLKHRHVGFCIARVSSMFLYFLRDGFVDSCVLVFCACIFVVKNFVYLENICSHFVIADVVLFNAFVQLFSFVC